MATAGVRRAAVTPGLRAGASKVPEITAWFWIIKVLTTGMGEATSDYLVHRINPVIAVGFGLAGLVIALALQFLVRRYVTVVYWLAVVMVAVFGTMEADVLHVRFRVPYAVSTAGFAVSLTAIFAVWYATEKTLSIHSIRTRRREFFYWATVMATFALGTAAGDLTAYTLHLGYLGAGVLFAVVILVPAFGYRLLHLNAILMFWFAYIVTRPLGASFADWLGVPRALGGIDLGRGRVSLVLTVIIAVLVGYQAVAHPDAAGRAAVPSPAGRAGTGPQVTGPPVGPPTAPHPAGFPPAAGPAVRGRPVTGPPRAGPPAADAAAEGPPAAQGQRGKGGRHRAERR
jgi:uncharacterized membrane-anchored protein